MELLDNVFNPAIPFGILFLIVLLTFAEESLRMHESYRNAQRLNRSLAKYIRERDPQEARQSS